MRTRHLVSLISGVLILSVLLPVGLSIWLAHQQVETSFVEELHTYSSRVAIRANKVASQGKDALQKLEKWQGAACSKAHLMEMRRVSYSYRYIQEVVYVDNNVPQCSSLEHESPPDTFPEPGKISNDGYRVWLTSHNDLGITRYMVAMGTAHYIVMIDPASFIDVIPYSSWQIDAAIIGNVHNIIITSSDEIAQGIITQLQKTPGEHIEKNGIIYDILPLPEMNISIITWASTKNVTKRLASAGLYLVACRIVNWPTGGNVRPADFTPYPVTASSPARCYRKPRYLRALSAYYLLIEWKDCRSRSAGALAADRR